MDFYLEDFNEEARKNIEEYLRSQGDCTEGVIATLYNAVLNDNCPSVAGEWENIQRLIPILHDMGYGEMRLRYEDCGIWVLYWHNPEFDGLRWQLIE